MKIPDLSNLSFLILDELDGGERTGAEIRGVLETYGYKKSRPAFYQLMGRLEDAGFVSGRFTPFVSDGQNFQQRTYRLEPPGWDMVKAVRAFHTERLSRAGKLKKTSRSRRAFA